MNINTILKKFLAISMLVISSYSIANNESSKIEGEFLSACLSAGTPNSVCKCLYSVFREKYTDDEFSKIIKSHSLTDEFIEISVNANKRCRK